MNNSYHKVGVLLTEGMSDIQLYSHAAATCRGKLVRLTVLVVGPEHVCYIQEGVRKQLSMKQEQGGGARNWELVDFSTARGAVIGCLTAKRVGQQRELQRLVEQIQEMSALQPDDDDYLPEK